MPRTDVGRPHPETKQARDELKVLKQLFPQIPGVLMQRDERPAGNTKPSRYKRRCNKRTGIAEKQGAGFKNVLYRPFRVPFFWFEIPNRWSWQEYMDMVNFLDQDLYLAGKDGVLFGWLSGIWRGWETERYLAHIWKWIENSIPRMNRRRSFLKGWSSFPVSSEVHWDLILAG